MALTRKGLMSSISPPTTNTRALDSCSLEIVIRLKFIGHGLVTVLRLGGPGNCPMPGSPGSARSVVWPQSHRPRNGSESGV